MTRPGAPDPLPPQGRLNAYKPGSMPPLMSACRWCHSRQVVTIVNRFPHVRCPLCDAPDPTGGNPFTNTEGNT